MRRRNQPMDDQQHREMLLRPPDRTWRQQFQDFFWDSRQKTCLTRTPINWLSITIYYMIFLTCTLTLFTAAMSIVYYMVNGERPHYILNESPVGKTPAMNFFPMESTMSLVWLSPTRSYNTYVDNINKVFDEYKKLNNSFDQSKFGECGTPPFGFDKQTPCLYLRMNRIIKWKPVPYSSEDELPKDAPEEVKKMVSGGESKVWVFCQGSQAKDRDHIKPNFFSFVTSNGFDVDDFPFDMQSGYIDPIVALKVMSENHTQILFTFTCSAWAKGLDAQESEIDVNFYFE